MKKILVVVLPVLVLALAVLAKPALSQPPAAEPEYGFDTLLGQWVRPDGGYRITITSVGADGKLEAAYANPSPLPFSQARASLDSADIDVFLELRAGGYNGSTYTLTYEPERDVLQGIYYQAVAKQQYEVFFERAR